MSFNSLPSDLQRLIASQVGSSASTSACPYPELAPLESYALSSTAIQNDGGFEYVEVLKTDSLDEDNKENVIDLIGLRTSKIRFCSMPKGSMSQATSERLDKAYKRVEHLVINENGPEYIGRNAENITEFMMKFQNITSLHYCWQTPVDWSKLNFRKLDVVKIYYNFKATDENLKMMMEFVKRHKARDVSIRVCGIQDRNAVLDVIRASIYDGVMDPNTGITRYSAVKFGLGYGSVHMFGFAFENMRELKEFEICCFFNNDFDPMNKTYFEMGDDIGDYKPDQPVVQLSETSNVRSISEFGNLKHSLESGNVNTIITLPNGVKFHLKGRLYSKCIAVRV